MVDIDPLKLQARGLTPTDVVNAVNTQNLTLPSGLAKIGDTQYTVRTNAMPVSIADLNNIPIKYVNEQTIFLKDVGQVHDGWAVQQNLVHQDGRRSVLLSVLKNGQCLGPLRSSAASARCSRSPRAAALPGLQDQRAVRSIEARHCIDSWSTPRGAIAAGLTGLMILLFLGSWRSTLIVLISIPLSILSSIIVLYFMGHTLNTMTLGGMALAVGILVDDLTVTIENTRYRLRRAGHESCGGDATSAPPELLCRRWFRRSRSAACSRR